MDTDPKMQKLSTKIEKSDNYTYWYSIVCHFYCSYVMVFELVLYLLKSLVKKVGADFVQLPLTEVGYHHGLGRTKKQNKYLSNIY